MDVIYGRISTEGQNAEIQKKEGVKFYIDTCSGSVPFKERKQAKKLINQIEQNNITSISVKSIDRLGRNLKDILETIEYFSFKNIEFYAERECLFSHNEGVKNPTFNLMVGLMGSIAEFERQRIKERTKEGIIKAKKEGKFLGRSFGSVESEEKILNKKKNAKAINLIKKGASLNTIVLNSGLSKPTVIKLKKLIAK